MTVSTKIATPITMMILMFKKIAMKEKQKMMKIEIIRQRKCTLRVFFVRAHALEIDEASVVPI